MGRPSKYRQILRGELEIVAQELLPPRVDRHDRVELEKKPVILARLRRMIRDWRRRGLRYIADFDAICETGASPRAVLLAFHDIQALGEARVAGSARRGWTLVLAEVVAA